MELEHVKGGNGNVNESPNDKRGDGTPFVERISQHIPPSPYSSGTEYDISELGSLRKTTAQSQYDGDLLPYLPTIPSLATSQITQTSTPSSPPQPSAVSTESSPMISPPIRAMGHPPGYDPNRIPSSIFSSNPANTSEWSATSNESLFIIHMGNNSFTRDYAIPFGKSGELSKPEDCNDSQSNLFEVSGDFLTLEDRSNTAQSNPQSASEAKHNELSHLPPVTEVPSHEESTVLLEW